MTTRTAVTTVTFRHSFRLTPAAGPLPAGTYRLIVDEEELQGVSFLATRRTATMLQIPAISAASGSTEEVVVDPAELEAALLADGRA